MPPIASKKRVFNNLCKLVGPSVVIINRYKEGDFVDFGTGFIIFSDRKQVLICGHESILHDGETLYVCFHDGGRKKATLFAQNTQSGHVVLKVTTHRHRPCVHFTQYHVGRQNIFTMAALEADDGIGLMSGTLSIPDCRAVRPNGTIVEGGRNFFAMSCPLSGPKAKDIEGLRLVGAAVFNMKGLVIGTVDHVDSDSFDIKYSRKTRSFLDNLERTLKNIDNTISFSKGEQGGFKEGTGTSRQGGTTAGSRSKKRGRDDPPSGGTRSLCMQQFKVNAEVVSKENPRLHLFTSRGDMDVARREDMRRELVRLVTRECVDGRTSSLSSPGLKQAVSRESRLKEEKTQMNQQMEFISCHLQPHFNAPSKLL